MTDKEKLEAIRAEVEEYISAARKAHTNITEGNFAHLRSFIDSLQEEPVNKDFEMALIEMIDKAQKCVVEPWAIAAQWKDYLIELAKSEEPASEELEKIIEEIAEPTILNAYGTKELARRLRNTVIYGTSVSEDLEEESLVYSASDTITEDGKLVIDSEKVNAFKAGAQWRFERVKEALLSEVLPCFMHGGEADEVVAKLDEV